VKRTVFAGGAVATAGILDRLNTREARAAATGSRFVSAAEVGYGEPRRARDQFGREILALPPAFRYLTLSDIGATMSDGNEVGVALDGMACFAWHGSEVRLIRNHEDRFAPGAGKLGGPASTKYDKQAGGGTTTLAFDTAHERLVEDFISLNGTTVNCAGGIAWRQRGWITGEEIVVGPAQGWEKNHGYNFFVPLDRDGPALTQPLTAMGRFSHEAVAVDQATGIVYETEDPGSGRGAGFYRFLPHDRGDLLAGGKLQILKLRGHPQADLRENQRVGVPLAVEWIDIDDPDPAGASLGTVYDAAYAKGAAKFNRLEGCWSDGGSIFFASTSGGGTSAGEGKNGDTNSDGFNEGWGQIWHYRAGGRGADTLTLLFESPSGSVLDGPDNVCVTPRGGLILCEDDPSTAYSAGDTEPVAPGITDVNRLIGLTEKGEAFEFAVNILNNTEFAGACFSPDGDWLFVNVFGDNTPSSGTTCAITGPWSHGPL
jgi:secreted PhoX family phosphatase